MGLLSRIINSFRKTTEAAKSLEEESKIVDVLSQESPTSDLIPDNYNTEAAKSTDEEFEIPDVYICRTCGQKFSTELELLNHHKSQSVIQEPNSNPIPEYKKTKNLTRKTPEITLDNEVSLSNRSHSSVTNPQIQNYNKILEYENQDGFLCKSCGRNFSTEYELQNHIHQPGDILAAPDIDPKPVVIPRANKTINTQFISNNEIDVTNLGSERLRYDKFPGKIGYTRKKQN
jgi:hypothetical protein